MRKDLSPDIAAYLAGLIDGEGTITLCSEQRSRRSRPIFSPSGPVRRRV
jgi:hypothetical protein